MQQESQNYFQLFGLPETFAVDEKLLAERYREKQGEVHPDRFAGAAEAERLRAVQMTSLINQAYSTLKAPLSRAAYMLELQQQDTEQVSQQDLGMELLMEQMQLREKLEELPADESALDELEKLKTDTGEKFTAKQQQFASDFEAGDILAAKKIFHEMQFLHKLLKEIDEGEEQRLGY